MSVKEGKFRFTYFTDRYHETFDFYQNILNFQLEHSWDRSEHDKGALFKAGLGLIEILRRPDEVHQIIGLDYRTPQGVFMCVQVWNIDELFNRFKESSVPFKKEIVNQTWGHRSFSIVEPNDIILFFFQEQF